MRRSIFYETKFIPEKERLTDSEFRKKLDSLLFSLLHQIFSTLSESIKIHGVVNDEIKEKKHMSDFLIFGECVSRVLGYEKSSFIQAYKNNQESVLLNAVDIWPIINILIEKLKDKPNNYEISINELHKEIILNHNNSIMDANYKHSKFPKTPSILSGQITKLNPVFRNLGYILEVYKYNFRDGKHPRGRRILRYTNTHIQSKLESTKTASSGSPASPKKKQAQNLSKSDEALKTSASPASPTKIISNDKLPCQNISSQAQKNNVDKASKSRGSSKNDKFTTKNSSGKADEAGEPVLGSCTVLEKKLEKITLKTYSKIKKSTKSFYCKTCNFGNFINLDSKSRISDKTLYEIHVTSNPKHKLEYSDEVIF